MGRANVGTTETLGTRVSLHAPSLFLFAFFKIAFSVNSHVTPPDATRAERFRVRTKESGATG